MKRSEINELISEASEAFAEGGWILPPEPRWDVTDFGLGDVKEHGLVLINLAEEPEYCEKLMYARENMKTPAHTHRKKKEDIIARRGTLRLQLWPGIPGESSGIAFEARVNGSSRMLTGGDFIDLKAGERITLLPGIYHEFFPVYGTCIIGEVSTANDDLNDNFFINPDVGRFPGIEENEAPLMNLIDQKNS
jgi:D-lyxose ketol-isomerase